MAGTTANRAYPFPESTDAPRVYADVEALADAIDTDVQGLSDDVLVIPTDTAVGTASTGFTDNSSAVWTALGGHLVVFRLLITVTTQINAVASAGSTGLNNVTDTVCYTLDTAYRPPGVMTAVWDNGTVSGSAQLATNGQVTLRTAGGNIATGNLAALFVYLIP